MLAKTGLLIVSNPKQIGKILPAIQKRVKDKLYIQLQSILSEPVGHFYPTIFHNSLPKYSGTIYGIYSEVSELCANLDVCVLLSGLKLKNISKISTTQAIDLVIFDKIYNTPEIDGFIKSKIGNLANNYDILTLDTGSFVKYPTLCYDRISKHVVLGGTFDRLHIAHKLLLSEAVLRSKEKVTVGVTDETMLLGKTLWELIEDLDKRIKNVTNFLNEICKELTYSVVPISDPYGPSIVDPTMEMIVVSDETIRGGQKINNIRQNEKKIPKLDIVPIKLIDEPFPNKNEEAKISSSTCRIRLLGTLLKPIENKSLPKKPYIIGLTGGVASGKTGVSDWLSQLGAQIINCDSIGHSVYEKGKPCYGKIVQHFGDRILTTAGEIDRKVLGGFVFKNPAELEKLNSLVWPEIELEVRNIIGSSDSKVIVIEAAVLLTAGWDKNCHEVWTTLVPRQEALERLLLRNGFTTAHANLRIDSQPSSKKYVEKANVLFYTVWDKEVTGQQVRKAWDLLQERLL